MRTPVVTTPKFPSILWLRATREQERSQSTPVAVGGTPPADPMISLLPTTTHWLALPTVLPVHSTATPPVAPPSPPPAILALLSTSGWQVPFASTPEMSELVEVPVAPTKKFSTTQGAAPP